MEIKVLKSTTASKDPTGTKSFDYLEGNIYDIYDELAEVFLNEGWGELAIEEDEDREIEEENKAIDKAIDKYENKAIDGLENKGSIFERFKPKKIK